MKYLWDTNIVIYFLQQQFPFHAEKIVDNTLLEAQPCISAISEIELYCWKAATDEDLKVLYQFIHEATVIELERAIKLKTADIRRQYKIKLPDAIIAATALVYGLTLITRNVKDFQTIPGLDILNPWA